jgi:hypothetical protein
MTRMASDEELRSCLPRNEAHSKYPWEEWQDGQSRVATRHQDFGCGVQSFVSALHNRAIRDGLKVHTFRRGDSVIFWFER